MSVSILDENTMRPKNVRTGLVGVLGFANLMSTAPELAGEIDTCEYLFLRELSEPKENSLRLLVEEAKPGVLTVPITVGEVEFGQGRPVHSTEECRLFEIFWDSYVAYSARNELYAKNSESEIVSWGDGYVSIQNRIFSNIFPVPPLRPLSIPDSWNTLKSPARITSLTSCPAVLRRSGGCGRWKPFNRKPS